jgi:hypothetical protein
MRKGKNRLVPEKETVINNLKIVKTPICKIPPNLPLPKGGITPLWKRGGGEIFQCLCQFNSEAVNKAKKEVKDSVKKLSIF